MPLYEYICKKCDLPFSEILSIKEHQDKKIECPKCHCQDVQHVPEPFFAKTSSKTRGW
jgi:putative FmdB family regulatory protein